MFAALGSIQAQKLHKIQKVFPEFNKADSYFGYSVCIDGDYAVVGAPGYQGTGAAYIFHHSDTIWKEVARLIALDAANEDFFGQAVSISGNVAIVGALGKDDKGNNSGAAYIFEKPASGWTTMNETVKLSASDGAANEQFGYSVSISGDLAVVGAPGDSCGSVYVFKKPANGRNKTTEIAKLTASDGSAQDCLGFSVSISGDVIIAGAPDDNQKGDYSGSAYIFEKPESGWKNMTETVKLNASDGEAEDRFGWSVSISGNKAIVGAWKDDDKGSDSGAAYIFEKSSDTWTSMTEKAKLTASDGAAEDYFGFSVDISGDIAIVGALCDDDAAEQSGSAYIFEKPASGRETMIQTAKLTTSDKALDNRFGISVSISDDLTIVGAAYDDPVITNSGSAYIIKKPANGWTSFTKDTIVNYNEKEPIYIHVKNMPEFPGGSIALDRYVAEHLVYPPEARKAGIQGAVFLRFEITKTGSIGKVELQNSVHKLLDDEAIRVIKSLPKFKPGEQNGKKVNVWFGFAIAFRL